MKTLLKSNQVLLWIIGFYFVTSYFAGFLNDYAFRILMSCGINIILAVSLNLITGITGQFSLGHAGFMAVGGYVSAALSYYLFRDLPAFFFFSLLAGGLAAAALGFLVGLPSLRLKGDYLAIVTLGFGEIIGVLIRNIESIGGSRGFPDIPLWTNYGWIFFSAALIILFVYRCMNSIQGRALMAIREDEIAAEAVGISTTRYKVFAFVVSSGMAGIAGGLLAHFLQYLNPSMFTFLRSFEVIAMVVLGGLGSVSGSILSAIALTILPEALRPLQEWTKIDFRMVIYSLILVILMLTKPHGLLGRKELWPLSIVRKRKQKA